MEANTVGAILTGTNRDCGCRLRIEQPCPHGDQCTCACGFPFASVDVPLRDAPG